MLWIFKNTPIVVIDVESIGLHGEGFAVGMVVLDSNRDVVDEAVYATDPNLCRGTADNHKWVNENVTVDRTNFASAREARDAFWKRWMKWKALGAVLAGECIWPVETNWLSACIADDPLVREWDGPYYFREISSILESAGFDPMMSYKRLENELPIHNPLNDARQSARLLVDAIKILERNENDARLHRASV